MMNGKPATDNGSGYIIKPNGSYTVKGWRRGSEKVAAFSFQRRAESYAAKTGHPSKIGIVRLVAIEEQAMNWARPRPRPPLAKASDWGRYSSPGRSYSSRPRSTGTGYGRELDSRVVSVPFRRSTDKRVVTLIYDTAEALAKAGVQDNNFTPQPPNDTASTRLTEHNVFTFSEPAKTTEKDDQKPRKTGAKLTGIKKSWTGTVGTSSNFDLSTKPVVTETTTWTKLWKEMYKDNEVPRVDFKKHLIVAVPSVATESSVKFNIDERGSINFDATYVGLPDDHWNFYLIPREGTTYRVTLTEESAENERKAIKTGAILVGVRKSWSGSVEKSKFDRKESLKKYKFIADPESWKELWNKIHEDKEVPTVDFVKHVIYIDLRDGNDPNRKSMRFRIDEKGTLTAGGVRTLLGFRPSKRYKLEIYLLPREGTVKYRIKNLSAWQRES